MRDWLPAFAFDRPVTVFMGFLALLVVGFIAWSRIPVQLMPSGFEPNFLFVYVPYNDATPSETDEDVVRPIEAQLGTVPGIRTLGSEASSGAARFFIEFYSSTDMDVAYNAVVDRVERAMPELPEDIERYWVYKYNPDDEPVLWVGASLSNEIDDPHHLMTRVVQPRLERVSGVATMDVWGVPQIVVRVDYDREKLFGYGIDLGDLQRRLQTDNFQMAGGDIEDRGQNRHVRSLSRLPDVQALARYPVKEDLVLEDIATVRMGGTLSSTIQRINGKDAAAIAISKESSANTVDVCRDVQEALEELKADKRLEGVEFFTFFDQGGLIEESLDNLLTSALTGGVFAVIVLFVFLREWRMTLLIALSIPFSLLITVGVLYFNGDTLNLLALMGLMLAVGMVVDNAIVVVETIYRRRAAGAGVRAAAVQGTGEVNLAIVLSTLTTMVVFLPVILMTEDANFSFFMGVLGRPVIFALAASLLVALVFAPLATRYIGAAQVREDPRWLIWVGAGYERALRWVLAHRADATMALLGAALLTGAVAVPGMKCTGAGDGNLNDFSIRFSVPPQLSMAERDAVVKAYEEVVEEHQEEWGVRVYRSRLRGSGNQGRIYVYLETDGPMERDDVMDAAKKLLPELPGVKGSIGWEGQGGGGNQITLDINGEDTQVLQTLAEEVMRRVRHIDEVINVGLGDEATGSDEVRLIAEREALTRYGLTAASVGRTVSYAMRGNTLPPLLDGEREIEVASQIALEDRGDLDSLLDFGIWSPTLMAVVPVRALTSVEVGRGPVSISRRERRTSTSVTLDLKKDTDTSDVYPQIDAALADMVLPRGYSWSRGQSYDRERENDDAQYLAMWMSITFVFLIMGVLFESWILPISVITTIPMAMFGAVWGLYLTGTPMDTMAGIGLVVLVGVVVNNGIVLVDLVTQLRAEGVERDEALLEAGRRRLRPILMTALTTIMGLVPMALGSSAFIGIPYAPLGRTVIFGLATATVLTLLFVPYLYTVLDDVSELLQEYRLYVFWGSA